MVHLKNRDFENILYAEPSYVRGLEVIGSMIKHENKTMSFGIYSRGKQICNETNPQKQNFYSVFSFLFIKKKQNFYSRLQSRLD